MRESDDGRGREVAVYAEMKGRHDRAVDDARIIEPQLSPWFFQEGALQPITARKKRREWSRRVSAKSSHEGHNRVVVVEEPDTVVDCRPSACPDCGLAVLPIETVSVTSGYEASY